MSEVVQAPAVEIPPEVMAFARERQVEAYLPAVIAAAARCFPGARLRVGMEEDPEVEDLRHIALIVEGLEAEVEEFLTAKDEYHRALFAAIPAPLLGIFRLALEG